jgi:hypothetical protein
MKHLEVQLTRDWGSYYKKGAIVSVSEDVAKMMTSGPDPYGFITKGISSDDFIRNVHFADEEE